MQNENHTYFLFLRKILLTHIDYALLTRNAFPPSHRIVKIVHKDLRMVFIFGNIISRAEVAQLVEHNLAKVGVAGSNPVFRSIESFERSPMRPFADKSIFF